MPSLSLSERLSLFVRLARLQFLPIVVSPLIVGTGAAWYLAHSISVSLLVLLLLGSVCLLIASNSIDDVYDFLNGVDTISDGMFPAQFPGWKPIPRGLMSVSDGLTISLVFYALSLAIGVYLSVVVGWVALVIAIPGVLLSYFYVAPPAKLDYRGLGLGELAIFLSFGPIPALGAFYVLTGRLEALPVLASVPSGLLTVTVLLTHDMMFYDSYKAAAKRSLTVVLGRIRSEWATVVLCASSYAFGIALIVLRIAPPACLLVLLALPLLIKGGLPPRSERQVSEYGKRTQNLFLHSVAFSLLFAIGMGL